MREAWRKRSGQCREAHGRVTQEQGSATPGPQTSIGPWPVRKPDEQQEVSGGRVSEAASSVFTAAPHRSYCCQRSTFSCSMDSVNVTCLKYPNTTPDHVYGKTESHETGPWYQRCGKTALEFKEASFKETLADQYPGPSAQLARQ